MIRIEVNHYHLILYNYVKLSPLAVTKHLTLPEFTLIIVKQDRRHLHKSQNLPTFASVFFIVLD